ncbi:MAG: rhomboid family intramembrane serine protease [Lachnospiraceae bacterium]|nr:rhomboid family intramembrane serine protease [Lachnospiraceae bacterium]
MAKGSGHKPTLKISFNSPVVLTFALLCLAALLLNGFTGGAANRYVFSVYRSSLLDPLTYIRFFGHVLGHANWAHYIGNMTLILLVGPLLEEKYGWSFILQCILVTAFVTGLINFIFFPHVALCGASGVAFAFILLSSFTSINDGTIPVTFILIAIIYIGGEIYDGVFVADNISQLTHVIGGIVGAFFGYVIARKH